VERRKKSSIIYIVIRKWIGQPLEKTAEKFEFIWEMIEAEAAEARGTTDETWGGRD
jgi:hypothetical protein